MSSAGHQAAAQPSAIERATMRRVMLRIVPFLMVCYFISYVDRVNAGFAALTMNKDIGLTAAMFGLGGGIFYVAYILFEIPSNIMMERVGARYWIARIMITWGAVGIGTAFIVGPYTFYLTRFLLGAFEAGFFPGVLLYLTYWFPKEYRARIVATFMCAIPISNFLGSPISVLILQMDGIWELRGWQWLFIVEAIPAVLLGLGALFFLTDRPVQAKWLKPEQREWLTGRLAAEHATATADHGHHSLWKMMTDKYVIALAIINCGSSATSNALSLWQPQILKSFGLSTFETGLFNAIPFGIASIFMIVWGLRADKSGERIWNTALPLILTSICLASTMLTQSLTVTMILLSLALVGNYAFKGPFWALAGDWLSARTAAVGLAAINTWAHIGTAGATALLGVIKDATGSFAVALLPLVTLTATGAILVVMAGHRRQRAVAELKTT
jgi:ACS family tartrate transporter-like MFS transporter